MTGNELACLYSLLYNGSYMIPEVLLTCVVGAVIMRLTGKRILGQQA